MKTLASFLKSRWLWGGVVVLVLFVVAYPNPLLFARTLARAVHPPIEPSAVAHISAALPNDPARIEEWVIENIVYDANDYAGWGIVCYIASPDEVLRRGRGPCYGQAVVLASILEDKGIPYRILGTFMHVWVDYDERQPRRQIENSQYAMFRWEHGRWHFQGMGWLAIVPRGSVWAAKLLWRVVPWPRKIALLAVILVAIGLQWQFWRRSKHKGG